MREDAGVLRWLAHSDIITPRCINTIHGREHGGFAVAYIAVLHDRFRGWDTTVNTAESAKLMVKSSHMDVTVYDCKLVCRIHAACTVWYSLILVI